MAFESRDSKYTSEILHSQHHHHPRSLDPVVPYNNPYNLHHLQTDENRNENNCHNKETIGRGTATQQQSLGTQTIEKVDAATMTDPLRIDFRLTSEYLARCSASNQTLSPSISAAKYEENSSSEASSHNCHEIKPKIHYDIEPSRHVDGKKAVNKIIYR